MNISLTGKNSRNLSVLQHIDPSIEEIITSVSHVAVYQFESSTTPASWKRYGVEGATFIVRRGNGYLLIVLNKHGLENLVLDLTECKKTKIQTPYIMVKCSVKKSPIILGLWFHDDGERNSVFETISSALDNMRLKASSILPSVTPVSPSANLKHLLNLTQQSEQSLLKNILKPDNNSPKADNNSPPDFALLAPSDFTNEIKVFFRD